MKHLLTILLLWSTAQAQSILFLTAPSSGGGGGGGRTSHFRLISVPSSSVSGGSDLSDFPMTFQGTYSYLATVANGGKVQNSSGYDILYALDSLGVTLCKWENEIYDPTTGKITSHIRLPTLSASTTTKIYILYDSASISTFQGGAPGSVWNSHFLDVWHFNETITGSGQTIHDYTSNGHNFTTSGSWTSGQQITGQVGGALSFLFASNDYLSCTSQSLTGTYTVSGWYFVPGGGSIAGGGQWWLNSDDESTIIGVDDNSYFQLLTFSGNTGDTVQFNSGSWYYMTVTRNGTTSQFFHNGIPVTPTSTGVNISFANLGAGAGGSDIALDRYTDDEEVSDIVLSDGWIATTYANQHDPGSWYTVGAEN